jgi:hypothetical protein
LKYNLEDFLIYEELNNIRYGFSHFNNFLYYLELDNNENIKKFYNNHKELFEFVKIDNRFIMIAKLPIESIVMYNLSKE